MRSGHCTVGIAVHCTDVVDRGGRPRSGRAARRQAPTKPPGSSGADPSQAHRIDPSGCKCRQFAHVRFDSCLAAGDSLAMRRGFPRVPLAGLFLLPPASAWAAQPALPTDEAAPADPPADAGPADPGPGDAGVDAAPADGAGDAAPVDGGGDAALEGSGGFEVGGDAGADRNEYEIVYIFGPADGDGDGYSDVDELVCNSNPDDFDSVPSGTVSGTVATGSNGIAGITVKVLDALDPMIVLASGTTDAQGDYSFADVPQGDVQVMVVEPLGFSSATNNVDEVVGCNTTSTVDFSLDELILVNNAMRVSYWKHQFDLAVAGRPISEDLTAIISEIENRFTDPHFNSLFAGMGDGVDDEQDWQALFSIRPSGGTFARARAQLAGVVMNVMAQKIAQLEVVTDDGRHVADVITYAAQLLEDADAGNDGTAYTVAEQVNRQLSIGAGVVPAGNVVYGQEEGRRGPALDAEAVAAALPETFVLENNYPNPFNPTTAIRFALPESAHVSLVVYNALGQTVAKLVDGGYPAGHHEVQFDAGNLPSGTYLYRLETPAGSFTKTMLLLK